MIKLIKLSLPIWQKNFDSVDQLKAELYSHICKSCRKGEVVNNFVVWNPIDKNSSIKDMLNTGCGCEYKVEIK